MRSDGAGGPLAAGSAFEDSRARCRSKRPGSSSTPAARRNGLNGVSRPATEVESRPNRVSATQPDRMRNFRSRVGIA
ncbi:hypothetical protein GQ85_25625 [Rhodococcus rhodochrous]|nr:hypothetical protein GQ85_25625 [Rhodococcus rhodochrous]